MRNTVPHLNHSTPAPISVKRKTGKVQVNLEDSQTSLDRILTKLTNSMEVGNKQRYLMEHEVRNYDLSLDKDGNLLGVGVNLRESFNGDSYKPRPQTLWTISPEGKTTVEAGTKFFGSALMLGHQAFRTLAKNRLNPDEASDVDEIIEKMIKAEDADISHPYLKENEIPCFGLGVDKENNLLAVAVNIDQSLKDGQYSPRPQTLITISVDGRASIEPGSNAVGAAHLLGQNQFAEMASKPREEHRILVAPDYETGATLHQMTGKPVAVAFGIQNMQSVAKALRKRLPESRIVICVNHDKTAQKVSSLEKANKISESVNGTVMQPTLTKEQLAGGLTSFGDMARNGFDKSRLDPDKPKETDKKSGIGR